MTIIKSFRADDFRRVLEIADDAHRANFESDLVLGDPIGTRLPTCGPNVRRMMAAMLGNSSESSHIYHPQPFVRFCKILKLANSRAWPEYGHEGMTTKV